MKQGSVSFWRALPLTAVLLMWVQANLAAISPRGQRQALLRRIFDYPSTVDTTGLDGTTVGLYTRGNIHIDKRNPTLMLVPTMYAVAHGGPRAFIGEGLSRATYHAHRATEVTAITRFTTIPHNRRPMDYLLGYLTPTLYRETLIDDYLASPFHRKNRHFYKYRIDLLPDGTSFVRFSPRRLNTQLVSGDAVVETATGRIVSAQINGDHDHVRFGMAITMQEKGAHQLFPRRVEVNGRFTFVGNKVSSRFLAIYGLPLAADLGKVPRDSAYTYVSWLRPEELSQGEQDIYDQYFKSRQREDSTANGDTATKRKSLLKTFLWDVVGDNVLNRVRSTFGVNGQGYVRLNPVLNPLYMGYDHRRGFTYKVDLRLSYQLGPRSEISTRFKGGYAFKQRQFYFRIPAYWYFDKQRDGYLKLEVGNGNHIRNSWARREAERIFPQTGNATAPDLSTLDEFRQNDGRLIANLDFNRHVGLQLGVIFQQKAPVDKMAYRRLGLGTAYRSFAPAVEVQLRPWGWGGPTFTADYDRSIKGLLGTNIDYERWELNGDWIIQVSRLQSWQLKAGTGFYTKAGQGVQFLNYENFREENLPGGWNDDWSGEFELLRSESYNTSDYYIRANASYSSPMLMLSHLPWVGHYMEMERLYASILDARHIHPYVEVGYGFTTRLASIGVFGSFGPGGRTWGVKFGFELFRKW